MIEALWYNRLVLGMFGAAAFTWAALTFIVAPYGRHTRSGWGPTLASRTGWLVMESPAVVVFGLVYALGRHRDELVPLVMLGVWMLHYLYRAWVFPFRTRSAGRVPVLIAGLGASFNVLNAYLNARWISEMHEYAPGWLATPMFLAGVGVFLVGWGINLHADGVLLRLRAPGETGYRVPDEGLHRLVAAPNYLGEIVEWIGWALLTTSPAGIAFAVYTMANLAPRAKAHLRWYRATFPEYPASRTALVPYVW